MSGRNAKPGDQLVATFLEHGKPPQVVTVERVTPSGRIILTEYPDRQFESLPSGGRVRGAFNGAFSVREFIGDESAESVRGEWQRWAEADAIKVARHNQVRGIRRKMEELESRLPSSWEYRNSTPDYPHAQEDLDALTALLDRFLDVTPKRVRR